MFGILTPFQKMFLLTSIILFKISHLFTHRFQVLLCITNNSIKHQSFVYTQLNDQTILFLTIQFGHSWNVKPIDRTLLGATTPGQSGHGSYGNEGVLYISQSSKTGVLLSDSFVLYPEHTWGRGQSYPSAGMQLVYSTVPGNWAGKNRFQEFIKNDQQQIEKERILESHSHVGWRKRNNWHYIPSLVSSIHNFHHIV